jgi:7,8-dihydropterin-6-yl-methyl-4-(beta-D-ribofuranosyl)aminobenzene 5'-phosphate synthase
MGKTIRITTLVEDTADGRGTLGEHGLAFLIDTSERKVLFDTGQGLTLRANMDALDVSADDVDAIVLSH